MKYILLYESFNTTEQKRHVQTIIDVIQEVIDDNNIYRAYGNTNLQNGLFYYCCDDGEDEIEEIYDENIVLNFFAGGDRAKETLHKIKNEIRESVNRLKSMGYWIYGPKESGAYGTSIIYQIMYSINCSKA